MLRRTTVLHHLETQKRQTHPTSDHIKKSREIHRRYASLAGFLETKLHSGDPSCGGEGLSATEASKKATKAGDDARVGLRRAASGGTVRVGLDQLQRAASGGTVAYGA